MTLTNDQKRQLALAFVQYPEHYKPESINDSHLCRFNGGKTRALVCVKSVDSGKRRPCIGFYFISPDKDENLRILRRSELPKGFYLNEDLVTDSQTGWVPFCRRDCETAVEMFRQIVSPGSRHSEWKQMFEFLKTWGRNHLGCQEEYYSSENWNMKDQVACQCNTADCATDEETSPAEEVAEVLVDNVLSAPADPFAGGCKASVVSVEQLLQMNLSIPSYQRPYKWTRRNVEELLQDIRESLKESHQKYRIGTVILDASCGGGRFGIVDGQQRVLTLLLINRLLNHIRRNKVCPPILGDAQTLSFLSSSNVSRKNLHENYAVVRNCLAKDYALRKRIVSAFNTTLEVVVVKVDELSEAFQLFDSQNTRGRALDPHDLLKAFHLRAMAQKAKALDIDAKKAEDEMKKVVAEWESQSAGALRSLFDNWLFRISNWSRKRRTHPFTAADIHEFKGVPFDSEYSFALRAKAAMPGGDGLGCRRFQIGEDFEEGREFFRMVSHYLRMVDAAKGNVYFNNRKEIRDVLRQADGKGFSHVENLFRCALVSYVDRFGEEALSDVRVLDKLCLWAFILRLDMNHVSEDSVNKYAVVDGGADYTNALPMFSVIKTAQRPSDVAIAEVCGVESSRFKRKQGLKGREQLFQALKKVEG